MRCRRIDNDGFARANGGAGGLAGSASAAQIRINHGAGNIAAPNGFDGVVGAIFIADHAVFIVGPRQTFSFFYMGHSNFCFPLFGRTEIADGPRWTDLRATVARLLTTVFIKTKLWHGEFAAPAIFFYFDDFWRTGTDAGVAPRAGFGILFGGPGRED